MSRNLAELSKEDMDNISVGLLYLVLLIKKIE